MCVCESKDKQICNIVKQDSKTNAKAKLACKKLIKRLRGQLSRLRYDIDSCEDFMEFLES